jgi:hypothetical protein
MSGIALISKSEYARRRGCTEAAVRRAVKDGRISLIDGKIDPVAADAQWASNSRVRAGSKPTIEARAADQEDTEGGYWQSRARREAAEAEMAELKLAEQRGSLVRAADVRAVFSQRLAGLRNSLLQIPARLSPVMAAESDQARCFEALQAELHAALAQASE